MRHDYNKNSLGWIMDGQCIRCTSHAPDAYGYPRMYRNGKSKTVARWILIHRLGNIPTNIVSRHTCDNRLCIRPDHILSGTQAQNVDDAAKKGKYSGENSPLAKLTNVQVLQIIESTKSDKELAAMFSVGQDNINSIRNRKHWKHI